MWQRGSAMGNVTYTGCTQCATAMCNIFVSNLCFVPCLLCATLRKNFNSKMTKMGRDPRIKFLWRYGWTRFSKCSGWPHKKWFFEVNFEVKPFQNDKANQTWSNDCHFALVLFIFFKNDRKSYLGPSTVEKKFVESNSQQPWDTLCAPKISILNSQVSKNIYN